jgi:hypothetical protein
MTKKSHYLILAGIVSFMLFLIFMQKPIIVFAQGFDFITSQEIQSSLGPVFTLTEDFNKDGNLDLAIGHSRSQNLSVFLGNGDGLFTLASSFEIGALNITAGDFDEDGNLDLVAAGRGRTVSVLLGEGNGSFVVHVGFFVEGIAGRGIDLKSIKSGDFDKDGHLDLLTAGFREYSVAVLFGDGHGNSAVEVNDLNNDTNLDLIVLNIDESRIFIFFGDGSGSFPVSTNFELDLAAGRALSVEDLNRDGNVDIIVGGANSRINTLFGDGQGNFPNRFLGPLVRGGHFSMAIADFNLDGNLDLAVPNLFTSNVDVVAGDGFGNFSGEVSSFAVSGAPKGATSGDFNKDGLSDLAIASQSFKSTSILSNNLFLKVNIDIKPEGFPNCINLRSKGLTGVAILGNADFSVEDVDPSSVKFAETPVTIKKNGKLNFALEDVNQDGVVDIMLHFATNDLLLNGDEEFTTLTGNLFGGKTIRGVDSICFAKGSLVQKLLEAFSSLFASTFTVFP